MKISSLNHFVRNTYVDAKFIIVSKSFIYSSIRMSATAGEKKKLLEDSPRSKEKNFYFLKKGVNIFIKVINYSINY